MATSGPPPKPTRLKELAGNPGKRRLNKAEPKFTPLHGAKPPDKLSDRAQKLWRRLTDQLEANEILTNVDLESLYVYCNAWDQYLECKAFLDKNGLEYFTGNKNGSQYVAIYPHVNAMTKAALLMDREASKFGLTPADRVRLHAPDKALKEEDGIEGIFSRRRG